MNVANTEGDTAVTTPTTDEAFTLLDDVLRRRLLVSLLSESSVEPDELVPQADGEVPTRLHHVHLPKLDDAEVVDWDRHRGVVSRGEAFDAVEPMLTLLADNPSKLPPGWL
ncbi:transcriptional regulator [Halomarina salina]|uniref:Transcriptional regulator n=1 Tax=Halomarina salina TaxID=1872699 RepID=A0ABD5RS06_9EURY|nr:hypothetical protein [Halomarina salina]